MVAKIRAASGGEIGMQNAGTLTMNTSLVPTSTKYYAYFWLTACALRMNEGWPDYLNSGKRSDYSNSGKQSDFDAFAQIWQKQGALEQCCI
jgi:hypothetical protein